MDIPRIDISPFLMGGAADKRLVADAVADCCRNLGFLVIAGHGMDGDGLRDAFALTREFMDLPNAVKGLCQVNRIHSEISVNCRWLRYAISMA